MALWRHRAPWLGFGVVVSVASVATAVATDGAVGIAGRGHARRRGAGGAVRVAVLGPVRVVLRYLERLTTHDATFRALADLRVWFFRGLAARGAGGLGFRRAGDMLSRLVQDVEALDGVYLRTLVPLAGAVLLLPVLVVVLGRARCRAGARVGGAVRARSFVLPRSSARDAAAAGARLARRRRGAAHRRARCAERPARGPRVLRRGPDARHRAGARGDVARGASRPGAARRFVRRRRVPVRPGGILAVLLAAGAHPAQAAPRRSSRSPRSRRSAGCRAPAYLPASPPPPPRGCWRPPTRRWRCPTRRARRRSDRQRAVVRGGAFRLGAGPAAGVRGPVARHSAGRAGGAAGAVRRRQIDAGGAGAEGGRAARRPGEARRRRYRRP